jgi:hypothetical protein
MDRHQVRATILEVARAVRDRLSEWRPHAAEEGPDTTVHEGTDKQRCGPFWVAERGYKYIDDVEAHLRRLFRSFNLLNPRDGSAVFEIGPGNCYLLFMCRELRGCQVMGVDWKLGHEPQAGTAGKPFQELAQHAHALFREQFGLEEMVRHQVVQAYQPVDFRGRYDVIVATHTAFNQGWGEGEYRYWLRDCYEHLQLGGRLMIALNKVEPGALAALPFLRPARPTPGFKKLTVLMRETVGQVLSEVPGGSQA